MLFELILIVSCCAPLFEGADVNSAFPRFICFPDEQKSCEGRKTFLEEYPDLSMSSTNSSLADTFFLLYTRKNRTHPELLHKCGGRLPPDTNYDPNKKLIVVMDALIFGQCNNAGFRETVIQLLDRVDANVLYVNYAWGNKESETAMKNIKIVAKQTVIVFKNIQADKGLDSKNIHLISVSLGAQLAGLIGYIFPIRRITGLDPAGRGYDEETPLKDRLDPSDADFVEVWHANMGDCYPDFGINYEAGHVNYYINGGKIQPACYQFAVTSLLKKDFLIGTNFLVVPTLCFHAFVLKYFEVSINPGCCQFVGFKCNSKEECQAGKRAKTCGKKGKNCMIMGYDLRPDFKVPKPYQRYYVETGLLCPYCITDRSKLQGFAAAYNSTLQSESCNK